MSRQRPSLGWPPAIDVLRTFPFRTVVPNQLLYRFGLRGRNPCWFSHSSEGRFDLASPHGTCYLAHDAVGALLEVLPGQRVTPAFLAARWLRKLRLPPARDVADVTARKAARFGITSEISTIVPYERPQAWAAALHQAGARGINYWLRHDPSRSAGVALFDKAGAKPHWKRGRGRPVSKALLQRIEQECGVSVEPPPRSDQLRFVGS